VHWSWCRQLVLDPSSGSLVNDNPRTDRLRTAIVNSMQPPTRIGDPGTFRPGISLAVVAVVALVIGGALGRFATAGSDAVAAPPNSAATSAGAGNAGDGAERIRRLEAAVAARPEDLVALQQLGTAYVQRAVETADPAFYALAEETFDRADAVRADQPATLLGRGALALSLHEFAEARTIGERLQRALPRSVGPLGVLTDAAVELGDYEAAAAHVQEMLDLDPGTAALARASYLRELHGDLDGAVTAMRQAVNAAAPGSFDRGVVTALVGDLHWRRGDLTAARRAYEDAGAAAPGLPAAQVGLARVEAAEGAAVDAILRLERLVERVPLPEALVVLGDLQAAAGDGTAANATAEVVRAVATLQRDVGQVVDLELAVFEADHGDPEEALMLAQRAHAARPDNVFAQHALAWASARSGDPATAVPLIEQALRLGSRDALIRYHAAVIFDAVGDRDRARSELAAAAQTTPIVAIGDREAAADLADRLGVALPDSWR
jgi:tetratricopeptide (TPR) repeat protein